MDIGTKWSEIRQNGQAVLVEIAVPEVEHIVLEQLDRGHKQEIAQRDGALDALAAISQIGPARSRSLCFGEMHFAIPRDLRTRFGLMPKAGALGRGRGRSPSCSGCGVVIVVDDVVERRFEKKGIGGKGQQNNDYDIERARGTGQRPDAQLIAANTVQKVQEREDQMVDFREREHVRSE